MTSSSSLYGSVTTQNTSSTNSTSLYGEAGTPIPDSNGNVVVRGDLYVLSGNILTTATTGNIFPTNATTINLGNAATTISIGAASGTTTINNALTAGGTVTAPGADFGNITIGVATDNTITTTSGDLDITATGNNGVNITSGSDAPTLITRNTTNTNTGTRSLALSVQTSGTPAVGFGNSLEWQVETAPGTTKNAGYAVVNITDLTPGSEDFSMGFGLMQNGAAADNKMSLNSAGNLAFDGDLTVGGVNLNLQPSTNFLYSESDNRTNRPEFQSTSGNSSGLRVRAPNATTSASSTFSVNNSSDSANTEFLAIQARGAALGDTFRFLTGEYIANVFNPSNKSISFTDGTNTYATVNPAGPTIGTDLTTKTYVDGVVASGVTSITGTANQVIASSPTGAVTLSLPQSIATTSNVTFADVIVGDDLTVQGNNVNLAQATTIGYSENNDRLNRPQIQSTTGNSSGLRIAAPNTGTSAFSGLTVTNSSDTLNNDFLTIQSRGSALSSTFRVLTGKYTAGVQGASNASIVLTDNTNTYATINPAGPTNSTDLTTKAYVDALPAGGVTSITGTANQVIASSSTGAVTLSLPQSIATTSTPTFAGVTTPTVNYTSGPVTITGGNITPSILTVDGGQTTLALDGGIGGDDSTLTANSGALTWAHTAGAMVPGSVNGIWNLNADGTTDFPNYTFPYADGTANQILVTDGTGNLSFTSNPTFAGGTFGNVTVGVDTDNTISTTSGNLVLQTAAGVNSGTITMASGVNGDITLAPNGTGSVILSDDSYVLGQLVATRNSAYVPPPIALTTLAGTNGIVVASSSGGAGYGASIGIRYHTGDTTAAANNAAVVNFSGASGTNSAPGGVGANLVLGSTGFDGYTAGTSNNYASTIATTNQGAGTAGIAPLQAQGYARQAFTNSTTVTTAVTGASGTGTTATLTFTTQNTSPYAVGQTVTIAGMTPSGYNGTVVLTGVTTSSVSYANATTGFTSGGTIAAANTVTAAGTGFRVRGFANSTNMTAGNRFNFMDLTASAATFKSAAYTFANDVITGSTLTASNYMTLAAATGSINQDTFTLKNTAATSTYATLNSTAVTLNGDTVSLRNSAGTTTYISAVSTGTTITGAGLSTVTRTTVGTPGVAESRPSMNIQLTRSDQATPNDNDGTSFRTRVAGSNGTFYTVSDINSTYKTGGDVQYNVQLANGDQTTGAFSGLQVLSGSITKTVIRAGTASGTPGASSVSDILTIEPAKITAAVPIQFPSYTVAAITAVTGAVGWQVAVSDSPTYAGRMAYWSTTATAAWRYIDDNTAV